MASQDSDSDLKHRLTAAEARLRESEARHHLVFEFWAQAVWETDAAGAVVADSPSWRAYTGQTLEEWLGYGWVNAVHPDDRGYAERQWREAVAAHALVNAEFRLRAPDGGWRWTNVRAAPMTDASGRIEKWLGLNIDIDAPKRAETALRESEGRFRSLFESMGQAYVLLDIVRDAQGAATDVRILELNPAYGRLMGVSAEEAHGCCVYQLFPDVDRWWLETCDRVARTGAPDRVEHRYGDGGEWFECWLYPRGENRIEALFEQITERKRAEEALRASEERQAFLLHLSDALRHLSQASDIQMTASRLLGDRLNVSRTMYAEVIGDETTGGAFIRGQHVREGQRFPDRIPSTMFDETFVGGSMWTDDRVVMADIASDPRIREEARRAWLADGIAAAVAVALVKDERLVAIFGVHHARPREWSADEIALIEEVAERTWASAERARAEANLRESERRLQVLVAELQHRVRNILTVIRSVFTRTANTNEDRDELVRHFEGRVSTLARTHVVVTRTADGTALLEDLIRDELLAATVSEGPKLMLEGPEVELDSRSAETLGLAIHELTTNALKYGALAHASGALHITWKTNLDQHGIRRLDLSWVEEGVPTLAVAPRRVGFGRELIEEVLPYQLRAETTLEYRGGGVRCSISLPLTEKDNGAAK